MIKQMNWSCWNSLNNEDVLNAVNKNIAEWSAELCFVYWNNLIYYIDNINEYECLCILACFEKEIFELIHDWQHHDEFHHTYNWIFSLLFLWHLIRQLKTYILHCSECKINQIKHHSLYSSLQFIMMSLILFHTITMNFILTLSLNHKDLNSILTVIDKFTKQVFLLTNKSIYTAADWTNVLLLNFIEHDWSISHQIISDQDWKFLFFFWHTIFECLNTKLLTFTAYHSQIDDQSEHTNQTVKITLHYYFMTSSDENFINILLYLQNYLNNFWNAFTDYALNELLYRFCINDILNALSSTDLSSEDYICLHQIYWEEAEQIIIFVNATFKSYYNANHQFITIKSDSMTYLRLFHNYIILNLMNRKLSNQCVESFCILKWIDHLVYWLELLFIMYIHFVVLIVQLELIIVSENNLYNCQFNVNSSFIENNSNINNINTALFYKIKCLLNKHIRHYEHKQSTVKYLVKWKKYNHNHNV